MSEINPYAPPQSDLSGALIGRDGGVWRDGGLLVMRKDAALPDRCVKCNAPANGRRLKRNLSWHYPAWYLLVLISPLIYIIVALCIRKTAKIHVGICKRHLSRRRIGIAAAWLLLPVAIATFFLTTEQRAWPIILGSLLILLSPIVGLVASRVVTPKKIDDYYVWLTSVNPDYLAQLPPVTG